MKFTKPPLSFNDQADLLLNRGLIASKVELIEFLKKENYYHLSGYLYPFRIKSTDNFMTGTSLMRIKEIMNFDSDLRLLVFHASSLLERLIRTDLIYNFTLHFNDPFAYTIHSSYPNQPQSKVDEFLDIVKREMNYSKEVFVKHYRNKYKSEDYLPAWMAAEIMSMGTMNRFYQLIDKQIKNKTVSIFNVKEKVFHSWLNSIRNVRNICAHHNRLWNRDLCIEPKIPQKSNNWNQYRARNRKKLFMLLSIMNYMLNKANFKISLKDNLHNLFVKHRSILIKKMDFPQNWETFDFWK